MPRAARRVHIPRYGVSACARVAITACVVATLVGAATAQTSSNSSTTEEIRNCDLLGYLASYDYEIEQGLLEAEMRCDSAMQELASRRFGPPTEFQIFEATCKGPCQDYADRWFRLREHADPPCDCDKLRRQDYFTYSCRTPTDYLCRRTGYCYDFFDYYNDFCKPDSCARFDATEDVWRKSRLACGAAAGSLSAALLGAALLWQLRQWRD